MKDISTMGMTPTASVISNKEAINSIGLVNFYHVECIDADGNLKWKETIKNLVTTEGLDYTMNAIVKGGTQISTWYVGLKDTGAPDAGDTATELPGTTMNWTEYTEYSEATREALTLGTVSAGSVNNSGNVASFTIDSPAPDVYGVFITDGNVKNANTNCTVLYAVGDFASAKVVDPNDTLNVTVTLNAAST